MSKNFSFIVILLFIGVNTLFADVEIKYTSPKDGSKYLRPEETIILSANEFINGNTLDNKIEVTGRLQGSYPGNAFLSDDGKTILFKTDSNFLYTDTITVNIIAGIRTQSGENIEPLTFKFIIRKQIGRPEARFDSFASEFKSYLNYNSNGYGFHYSHFNDSLPADFPQINILNSTNPSNGRLFFSNFNLSDYQGGGGTGHHNNEPRIPGTTQHPYIIIAENSGEPYYYKRINRYAVDFKKTSDGNMSYYDHTTIKYYLMDTGFVVIDSFQCGNGYTTDNHELIILDNGHALIMSYDEAPIDMSLVVPGGNTNALVTGLIIQELDRDKNVVFQWRSWDDIEITEATRENLTLGRIDYAHGNSIEQDYDGNLIISMRHTDQVIKVNRETGKLMWRLGGTLNEFTFINDTRGFSHQHDARRVAPGRITIFDNGNFLSPPYSRVIEYEIDEVNKTAELVWQFDHNKELFAFAMGNAQRLPNGNTLIGWGTAAIPNMTEVDPNGNIVFELAMGDSLWSYRAFRFPFNQPDNPIPSNYNLSQNYPNPFNPSTSINFDIPYQSYVTLKVYDLLGREVDKLVSEELNSGSYNIVWNAENLSSGVYFYSLVTENFTDTKKMVLLK